MPRGKRYIVPGCTYHITHRCHGRDFLLKFKRDRTMYRNMLRERVAEFDISLLSYCITSNHVHLLLAPDPSGALASLSRFMQSLEGDFAQFYNRRKGRQNAFWGDRYHATMIESGEHLWRCLLYIDLNMVRAGVVNHPNEWPWTGYQELMGHRKRYRMLDIAQLLDRVGAPSELIFRERYAGSMQDALARRALQREAKWTESLAVGSEAYVKEISRHIGNRMHVEIMADHSEPSIWVVRETSAPSAYG